jgi:predicted transcriptional regulator
MRLKNKEYKETVRLRKKGKSYREIAKSVGVSKNSVSRWCKNLVVPSKAKKIIEEKIKHNKHFFESYNKHKHEIVQLENKEIIKNAIKQVSSLTKRELMLIGAALYWGEGYKRQDKISSPCVRFVNSDPAMIKLFLKFLHEIMLIPKEKIRADIRIHPNIKKKITVNFWSRITNIKKAGFKITRQISRLSQGKRPKHSLPYGTLSITVNSRKDFFRIKGWINGLAKNI